MAEYPASPPQQKVSRYRSQRQQAQQAPPDDTPAVPQALALNELVGNDGLARQPSQSRYRRKQSGSGMRPATSGDQEHLAFGSRPSSQRISPAKPFQTKPTFAPTSQRDSAGERGVDGRQLTPPAQLGASDVRRIRSQEMDWDGENQRRQRLTERYSNRHSDNMSPMNSNSASQTPTGELFPPPRPEPVRPSPKPVLVDGPPTSDQIRATESMSELPKYLEDDDEDTGGCFGFFKRKRGEAGPRAPMTSPPIQRSGNEPATIRPGGGGIVPRIDAPVSAVNTGDRRVLVECGKSRTVFPVTQTTTTVDIIKSAVLCISERIDVKSAVLLESFCTVGIQRPLRRYESIRNVMNSWDSDSQNSLVLIDPGTGTSEADLGITGVPTEKPGDECWYMTFSQKIGKWDKRLITLRSDGQVVSQKDPDKPKDIVNVCHLSDFDIYMPTQERVRKKIKPPKKHCFAIKSQQKTTMFESTHDFVHFFCTNDKQIADDFYTAVQGWRSWYLVNVMGEGRKPQSPPDGPTAEKELESRGLQRNQHRMGKSLESQYQLGSFKPLINIDDFEKDPVLQRMREDPPLSAGFTKSSTQFDTTISPERRASRPAKKHPSGSLQSRAQLADDEPLGNLGRQPSVNRRRPSLDQTKASPEEFLSTGLLGRTYSQRQKDQAERESGQQQSPWTKGPSLLHTGHENAADETPARRSLDGAPRRTHSTRAQQAHRTQASGDLQRSSSRAKEMPKPLVDLTPQYREPPQHSRKGRGHQHDSVGPGPLIDNATSPEDPLGIPPSTDWRGRNAPASSHGRSDSHSRIKPTQSVRRPATSRENSGGFTGEGLLAGSHGGAGWGGGEKGRGVLDGSRARGPLLDVNERSMFAQGSLLNRVEHERPSAPVVDRTRDDERAAW